MACLVFAKFDKLAKRLLKTNLKSTSNDTRGGSSMANSANNDETPTKPEGRKPKTSSFAKLKHHVKIAVLVLATPFILTVRIIDLVLGIALSIALDIILMPFRLASIVIMLCRTN